MNVQELIKELEIFDPTLPVMIHADHGQTPEDAWCVQKFYRPKQENEEWPYEVDYGKLEDMLEDYNEDELEQFVMIN
jgi:hypothetical protein